MAAKDFEAWLPLVAKPSRYIDHEINAVRKPWQRVNFCFIYPDVYEVGISHLGIKILYSVLNRLEGVMADRCYLPWLDMADIMRREGIPLFGLESRRPLNEFSLLGFTLQSELTYSNILETLDLAGIPMLAAERSEADPILLAGGPCATNPLPLERFFDAFFLGEAEEAIQEIARVFLEHAGRNERLEALACISGCYVPSLHKNSAALGWRVKARKFAGYAESDLIHSPQLLSWQLATHNRCVSEIMRGCSRGCRFCHAGYFYRPVRERPAETIRADLLREIAGSGWDEAGLLSLSSSDYSRIKELLGSLLEAVDTARTHVSLPSLRVDTLDDDTVELMRLLGREGLTIAPEAGSERLRRVINKNLSEEQILDGVRVALKLGWQKVKLYFMIGLPWETEEDIDGIIDLIGKIIDLGGKRLQINVTLSPFVPKVFTPFQWAPVLAPELLLQRCLQVKQAFFRQRQVKVKYHTIENSLLEAAFSRGDESMGEVLLAAWRAGARFDGWHECFDYSLWQKAYESCGVDPQAFYRGRAAEERLPWDFIDTGIEKGFLLGEWSKAQNEVSTPDCRDICGNCGVCGSEVQTVSAPQTALVPLKPHVRQCASTQSAQIDQIRYRIHYTKTGVLRFISHLDWMRMLFRVLSKADFDLVLTQGFSPHPKASLCPPLPLGVESVCEYVDISLRQVLSSADISAALSQSSLPEFKVLSAERVIGKPIPPQSEAIRISLPADAIGSVRDALDTFFRVPSLMFTKATETRSKTYDLRQIVQSASWDGDDLILDKSLASPSLYDVLGALFAADRQNLYQYRITRVGWL